MVDNPALAPGGRMSLLTAAQPARRSRSTLLPSLAGRSKPTGALELAFRHPMGRLTPYWAHRRTARDGGSYDAGRGFGGFGPHA